MAASAETWAEIKRAYTETRETQVSIAERAGLTTRAIAKKAKTEGWVRPEVVANRLLSPRRPGAARKRSGESLVDQATRVARMNLDLLEQYMESGEVDVGSPEHERVTRVMGGVTGALTKLGDLGANEQARGDRSGLQSAADIERRRHEIAERLERVLARRLAAGRPDGDAA